MHRPTEKYHLLADVEKDKTQFNTKEKPVTSKGGSVTRAIKRPTEAFPDFDASHRVASRSIAWRDACGVFTHIEKHWELSGALIKTRRITLGVFLA